MSNQSSIPMNMYDDDAEYDPIGAEDSYHPDFPDGLPPKPLLPPLSPVAVRPIPQVSPIRANGQPKSSFDSFRSHTVESKSNATNATELAKEIVSRGPPLPPILSALSLPPHPNFAYAQSQMSQQAAYGPPSNYPPPHQFASPQYPSAPSQPHFHPDRQRRDERESYPRRDERDSYSREHRRERTDFRPREYSRPPPRSETNSSSSFSAHFECPCGNAWGSGSPFALKKPFACNKCKKMIFAEEAKLGKSIERKQSILAEKVGQEGFSNFKSAFKSHYPS